MNDKMKNYIKNEIMESYKIKKILWKDDVLINTIKIVAEKAIKVYKNKNKILIAGNGGSAADAQHIAGELVSRFKFDRPGLPAIALTTDTSIITSIGNDYGYDYLFERQIQANGMNGDMFIGITTSGNSINIIKAFEECKKKGIITVGITGKSGGKIEGLCDYCIKAPSNETPRIQECHIMIGHIICAIIEKELFGEEG
ncbi:D-sedoheptulose 7-phosphate isomerase [Lutibacter sp. B2]|nr:D-sedoheptulose 7-phosphate isomerase [Lutibacter sp. B2]